jgi:hypothetical protein
MCVAQLLLAAGVSDVSAQSVLLQIRPHVGDTLRMRLDQHVEMSGTMRVRGVDSTSAMSSTLMLYTRAIVEGRDGTTTTVVAHTDSVVLKSSEPDSASAAQEARRALVGRSVRLRVSTDGATDVIGGAAGLEPELQALFAQMPATLPKEEITVGRSWSRVMTIPLAGDPGGRRAGSLTAKFRLDSLTHNGDLAFLSINGTLARSGAQASEHDGTTLATSGAVTGMLIVDRRRGWITDARFSFTVRSLMTPPPGTDARPMRFRMKVSQWMRVVP